MSVRSLVLAALLPGCVPLPPAMMPLQGPSADPTGSGTARLYGTLPVVPGQPASLYGAGGLRLSSQFTPLFSAGVEGTYVNGLYGGNQQYLYEERAHGRFSMLDDHLALTIGLGAQTEGAWNLKTTGTSITTDIAVSFGWKLGPIEPYAAVGTSLGFGVWDSPPPPEGYFFAGAGLAIRPASGWRLGAELDSFLFSYQLSKNSGIGSLAPVVVPVVSAAYVFGDGAD